MITVSFRGNFVSEDSFLGINLFNSPSACALHLTHMGTAIELLHKKPGLGSAAPKSAVVMNDSILSTYTL